MRHFVLPDVQAKPGKDFSYLTRIAKYVVEKQPDKVICIGDFADMPSLSSYDVGKKSFEGRRYIKDIDASHEAMDAFMSPFINFNARARQGGKKQYKPDFFMHEGNHDYRITRAVNDDPKLDGVLSMHDLSYADYGWKVYPFLEVAVQDGVAYSHYFTSGLLGRPVPSAASLITKKHMSCVMGHQQGLQIATSHRADGKRITAIIAGSCYEHDEDFMGPQGNKHWRGAIMLHEVNEGEFDLMPLSLNYFNNREYK
jgi:hypothetical protein